MGRRGLSSTGGGGLGLYALLDQLGGLRQLFVAQCRIIHHKQNILRLPFSLLRKQKDK